MHRVFFSLPQFVVRHFSFIGPPPFVLIAKHLLALTFCCLFYTPMFILFYCSHYKQPAPFFFSATPWFSKSATFHVICVYWVGGRRNFAVEALS